MWRPKFPHHSWGSVYHYDCLKGGGRSALSATNCTQSPRQRLMISTLNMNCMLKNIIDNVPWIEFQMLDLGSMQFPSGSLFVLQIMQWEEPPSIARVYITVLMYGNSSEPDSVNNLNKTQIIKFLPPLSNIFLHWITSLLN